MDALNTREIRDAGTLESHWLAWLDGQRFPPASVDELCPGPSRLVVVAPHPDDEVLACGGLLAMRAERGLSSLVVAVTDGEASHGAIDPPARARLSARRVAESHAGLEVLGLAPSCVTRLGIPDGEVAQLVPSMVGKLLSLLRPSDVVVTTWALDGHPDHEASSTAAQQAIVVMGCRLLQAPVWMWHWASPADPRVPWTNLVALDLPERALSAKRLALSRHQSQLENRGDGVGPVLIPSIVERSTRVREYFFS